MRSAGETPLGDGEFGGDEAPHRLLFFRQHNADKAQRRLQPAEDCAAVENPGGAARPRIETSVGRRLLHNIAAEGPPRRYVALLGPQGQSRDGSNSTASPSRRDK
jgi:hypothetical protein